MRKLKIEYHTMYLAVLLTFTPINYTYTNLFTVETISNILANVDLANRHTCTALLKSIDTSKQQVYTYQIDGQLYQSKEPFVEDSIPLPCNQNLLNQLADTKMMERYIHNYKSVATHFKSHKNFTIEKVLRKIGES